MLDVSNAPISELQKRLGITLTKKYKHFMWCNSSGQFPIGTPGTTCCCRSGVLNPVDGFKAFPKTKQDK